MAFIAVAVFLFWISLECRMQQRAAIKTFVRVGDSVKTAIQKLNAAWPGHALSSTQVRFWFRRFSAEPDRSVKDGKHTGR